MSKIDDLIKTIRDLQTKKYDDLHEDLVIDILNIEANFYENRSEAIKRIEKKVDQYLADEKIEDE